MVPDRLRNHQLTVVVSELGGFADRGIGFGDILQDVTNAVSVPIVDLDLSFSAANAPPFSFEDRAELWQEFRFSQSAGDEVEMADSLRSTVFLPKDPENPVEVGVCCLAGMANNTKIPAQSFPF